MEDCEKTISERGTTIVYTRGGQFVATCIKTIHKEKWYNANDKLHRVDGPAEIRYKNGQIIGEFWYHDGKLHRDNRPAAICHEDGQKTRECWYRDGEPHRDDGPAVIYYENGQITGEYWYHDGKFGGNVLAYVWLADINMRSTIYVSGRKIYTLDEFRNAVKGSLALELMRPLPIPIRDAIYEHYCLQ